MPCDVEDPFVPKFYNSLSRTETLSKTFLTMKTCIVMFFFLNIYRFTSCGHIVGSRDQSIIVTSPNGLATSNHPIGATYQLLTA